MLLLTPKKRCRMDYAYWPKPNWTKFQDLVNTVKLPLKTLRIKTF